MHATLPACPAPARACACRALRRSALAAPSRWRSRRSPTATASRSTRTWPHPQFAGRFLPRERTHRRHGFRAELGHLRAGQRHAQAQYLAGGDTLAGRCERAAAVGLVDPVNVYTQADRASKYGLLFVLLTFVGFFLFELIKQLPIHPIQYALVGPGAGDLLPAAAQPVRAHRVLAGLPGWRAWPASACSASTCRRVLRSRRARLGFAAMLTALYGALYGLLVSEDNALVLGSLLLFAILAAIMLATRRIDWYSAAAAAAVERGGAARRA